jgi:hypothetical protein
MSKDGASEMDGAQSCDRVPDFANALDLSQCFPSLLSATYSSLLGYLHNAVSSSLLSRSCVLSSCELSTYSRVSPVFKTIVCEDSIPYHWCFICGKQKWYHNNNTLCHKRLPQHMSRIHMLVSEPTTVYAISSTIVPDTGSFASNLLPTMSIQPSPLGNPWLQDSTYSGAPSVLHGPASLEHPPNAIYNDFMFGHKDNLLEEELEDAMEILNGLDGDGHERRYKDVGAHINMDARVPPCESQSVLSGECHVKLLHTPY